jgi:hypothetical protein
VTVHLLGVSKVGGKQETAKSDQQNDKRMVYSLASFAVGSHFFTDISFIGDILLCGSFLGIVTAPS